MDYRNTKIHVKSEEESRAVQKILFEKGCYWYKSQSVRHTDKPYLFVDDNMLLGWDDDAKYFKSQPHTELEVVTHIALSPGKRKLTKSQIESILGYEFELVG